MVHDVQKRLFQFGFGQQQSFLVNSPGDKIGRVIQQKMSRRVRMAFQHNEDRGGQTEECKLQFAASKEQTKVCTPRNSRPKSKLKFALLEIHGFKRI